MVMELKAPIPPELARPYPRRIRHGRPTFPVLREFREEDRRRLEHILFNAEETGSAGTERAIYLHIPFCDQICPFCLFDRVPKERDRVARYLSALRSEIVYCAAAPAVQAAGFTAVYFGGGTPTCLAGAELAKLVDLCRDSFSLSPAAEFTVEGNPHHFTPELVEMLLARGVNRLSLGVQTFADDLRRSLGLPGEGGRVAETIRGLHRQGCRNVDIDLIYGFPGQTLESWAKDVETAIALELESVSVFDLIIHPQTPLGRWISEGRPLPGQSSGRAARELLPSEEQRLTMYVLAREMLLAAGYTQQHLYQFVRPGFATRYLEARFRAQNNSLALGNTAAGRLNGFVFRNPVSWEEYTAAVTSGRLPAAAAGALLTGAERVRDYVIKSLELLDVDRAAARELSGLDPLAVFAAEFSRLEQRGLLATKGDHIVLTEPGIWWGWNVIAEFYPEEARP